LPPILYIFSLQSIERHLNKRYAKEIGDIYTGDTRPLFDGSVRLQDAINNKGFRPAVCPNTGSRRQLQPHE